MDKLKKQKKVATDANYIPRTEKSRKTTQKGKCYDLNLTKRFAGNVCQNLNLAIWANVGNVQIHWERWQRWQRSKRVRRSQTFLTFPDVPDVPRRS